MMYGLYYILRMGQDTSLNCRSSSQKPDQHQIQTTQANAVSIMKSRNTKAEEESDIKSKKSTTIKTQDNYLSIHTSNATNNKNNSSLLPQHENILKAAYTYFKGSQKMGNKYSEKGTKNLAEIVEPRYNTTMHFPQSQVAILIESLIYSLTYLHKFQYKHHDYYPTNIHYCNGIFKINNPLLVNSSAYVLTQQRKRFSFLSPELISEILNETSQAEIPLQVMWKSDIFSIGMIVLQFCTLQPSAQCYDEENYSLVDKIIRERLVKVAKLYSNNIADCIAEMLRYQVEERISVEELAILVFLNSQHEKIEQQVQQDPRMSASKQLVQQLPPKPQYLQNPPHVQQQFLVLPPGQAPPPGMHLPTNHQPLTLNPNSIAIPTPNYAYTRIGPNNQGLLSPTSLQNKLKVIELIHQNPQQEQQSQGIPSHLLPMQSVQVSVQPKKPTYQISPSPTVNVQRVQLPPLQNYPVVHATQDNFRTKLQEPVRDFSREQRQIRKIPEQQATRYNDPPKYSQQYQQPQQTRPSGRNLTSNKYLNKVDENGQTLQQRVQRILQMSRSIK